MKSKTTIAVLIIGLLLLSYSIKWTIPPLFFESMPHSFYQTLKIIQLNFNNNIFASELISSNKNAPNKSFKQNVQLYNNIENKIIVYTKEHNGQINKKIFGNNLSGYILPPERSGTGREWFGHSNYGTGIWNPKIKETNEEVIALAKNAGISIVRFPGGHYSDYYNWKDAIGNNRKKFLYGIDEFLKTCKESKAEVVYTLNYLTGNESDAADLVEYLNSPNDGTNPNDGIDWAAERSKNGHPEPYNVKYFEIGNEVWDKSSSEKYAWGYIKFYNKMKSVDPDIKIGVVLLNAHWNQTVMSVIKDKVDFGIIHSYPSSNGHEMFNKKSAKSNSQDIFIKALSVPALQSERVYKNALKIMRLKSGKSVPLAITEYNGGFIQDKPVPYRHTLGTALINAELLRIFLKPENNILMANYWQYCNAYFGMIKSNINFMEQSYKRSLWYIKRPNYYVYQLFNKHFGDVLIKYDLISSTYKINNHKLFLDKIKTGKRINKNLLKNEWEISTFAGSEATEIENILEINFKSPKEFNYYHAKQFAVVTPDTYYILSGYIKTENLIDKNGVCLSAQWGPVGVETATVKGTTDWTYCQKVFKTPPNIKKIGVYARRIGESGPLRGKAYFKAVRLRKFKSSLDTNIPDLSVTTSKSSDNKTVYLMVINKNLEQDIETEIVLNNFIPDGKARTYTLWGNRIDSTNEHSPHNNVRIYEDSMLFNGNTFKTLLRKHSLTAIEIPGNYE